MYGFLSQVTCERNGHPREYEFCASYRVYLFGAFRLLRDSHPVAEESWKRNKVKTLFKWLVLNAGRPCAADQMIDLFWRDVEERDALRSLYVTIHYLRHLLEPNRLPRQESRFLLRDHNNFYWLELDDSWWLDLLDVDYWFARAQESERHGDAHKALTCYRHVLHYARQGFLPQDADEPAFEPFRRQFDGLCRQVIERALDLAVQENDQEETLDLAYQARLLGTESARVQQAVERASLSARHVLPPPLRSDTSQS